MANESLMMRNVRIDDLEPDPRTRHGKSPTGRKTGRPKGSAKTRAVASILHDLGWEPISRIVTRLAEHGDNMDDATFIAANVQLARFIYPQMSNKPFERDVKDNDIVIVLGGIHDPTEESRRMDPDEQEETDDHHTASNGHAGPTIDHDECRDTENGETEDTDNRGAD